MLNKFATLFLCLYTFLSAGCSESDPYDVSLCEPALEDACAKGIECTESGYNFFTESGSFSSSSMGTVETCVEAKMDLCDEANGINYGACQEELDKVECAEDEDGYQGALLPEECKWITGDLS